MQTAESNKKVLIVSFLFPPAGGIGTVRVGKLAKYLPEFGWEPIVLTVNIDEKQQQTLPVEMDEVNIARVPYFSVGTTVHRNLVGDAFLSTRLPSANYSLKRTVHRLLRLARPIYTQSLFQPLISDPIGWYPNALKKGREIISKHKIDAIFSSFSPSTSHLVASKLQRQTGLPWVAEFRDLWSQNPYSKAIKPLRFLERYVERRVMRNSSLLITVSDPLAQQLRAMHAREVVVIPNGFDEEDYLENVPLTSKFTITYTGNIYAGKRDPTPLFEAVRELKEEGKVSSENFEVRFFGGSSLNILSPLVEKYQLGDLVTIHDSIPRHKSIIRQKESTIILLLEWLNPAAKGIYSGKVFEYIGAQRPILAIAYEGGVVNDLLFESGTGILTNEVETIKKVLCCWLKEWQRLGKITSYWKPRQSVIKRYTRREQARKLAESLDKAASGRQSVA